MSKLFIKERPRLFTLADLRDLNFVVQGAERGYNERADVVYATIDGTDLNEMWREIAAMLGQWNNWRDTLLERLTYRTNNVLDTVGVPGSQVNFEKASEYGQPVGIRGGAKRTRGYTFDFYDIAVRYTWLFLAEADRAQIQQLNNSALEADNRLVFTKVMDALFDPTNLVGMADSNITTNVYKFWNADGEVPPAYKSTTFAGSHTHYLVSNTATVTSANVDAMQVHLNHHGTDDRNGARLILMVNSQEGATIRGFARTSGAKYDFLPSENYGGGVYLPANGGVIAKPGGVVPGEIGTYGQFHVVEEDYIPAGYMLALGSGGPNNLNNPIGIREHQNPALRGLKIIPGREREYPLVDSFYRRGFGVGVRQRGAGVIMQVKASGTYDIPTLYNTYN